MHQILIYSDSLSWGVIPNTRQRLDFDERWPGVFENVLNESKRHIRVIENCLNGRRSVWDDPFKSGRKGSDGLAEAIEMNSPLKLVILMLGTNDFQDTHNIDSFVAAKGIATLIKVIREAPIEPKMKHPDILVVCPPKIISAKENMAEKFRSAGKKWRGFDNELEKIVKENSAHYYDSNIHTQCSLVDGVHLDLKQHAILGKAIAKEVLENKLITR